MSKKAKSKVEEVIEKNQPTDEQIWGGEPQQKRERPKDLKTVSSGAGYWDFSKKPIFEGHFVSKFLAPKDIPANKTKKGDVIGFNFVEDGTGAEVIISNSYAIQKALEEDGFKSTTAWWIEFVEKKMVKGKPFNSFYIGKH